MYLANPGTWNPVGIQQMAAFISWIFCLVSSDFYIAKNVLYHPLQGICLQLCKE